MKKFSGILLALMLLAALSFAQEGYPTVSSSSHGEEYNHGEIGVFMNYFRLNNPASPDTNFYGAGGRVGINVLSHVQLEAEGAYDFEQNTDIIGNLSGFTTSPIRVVHFMFGPKFQVGTSGPIRAFVTAKGGFIDFSTDTNFGSQVTSIPTNETDATFYPAAGFEFFVHWLGLRFEAGDEMYFTDSVHHNVRVTGGPVIRF
jgi:hypothetical protein